MPSTINYDASKKRLLVGQGYIERVEPGMWKYKLSGKQVVVQWFSYRKADRERPLIGTRRQPSPLVHIQPDYWLPEYTTELINLLNVLGLLLELEPVQAQLLERICTGPTISAEQFSGAGALTVTKEAKATKSKIKDPTCSATSIENWGPETPTHQHRFVSQGLLP